MHFFLILTTKINIFPELVVYPWMMSRGLVIYRDFPLQHGYFLQLLLMPFSIDKSLFAMKCFFIAVQTTNLYFVIKILKKSTNKLGFLIGCGLFIVLNYYLTDSNLWDEMIVTSFYLFVYCIVLKNPIINNKKLIGMGILLGFSSFMKPSFMIMALPLVIYYRNFLPFISIMGVWAGSFLFFFICGTSKAFLDSYILYNKHYSLGISVPSFNTPFMERTLLILLICICLFIFEWKKFKRNPILLFTILSFALFFPSCNRINLVPFGAFLSILIGQVIGKINKLLPLAIFTLLAFFYLYFMGQQAKHAYMYYKTNRFPYLENTYILRLVTTLKNHNLASKKIYVLGNDVELYYYLDSLPMTWYTIMFDVAKSYFSDVEMRTMREINTRGVQYIIIPKPLDRNYEGYTNLIRYIQHNYALFFEDSSVTVLKKTISK